MLMTEKLELTIRLELYSWNDLEIQIQNLVLNAKASAEKAYAPYSDFLVGAALLLDTGEIICGNNQENLSYPAGICAERVALSYAQANFPKSRPSKMAIVGKKREKEEYSNIAPCGICRQTISEYEQKFHHPIELYLLTQQGKIIKVNSMDDLLPFKFSDFR
jgi:cytidine deaminase